MASNSIAPIPCCVSKNDGCKSAHGVIFLRRRAVARWVRKNKHSNDNPGNNKVTCCRLGSAAIQDTLSIESENHLLPVHADEIFAVPFRHAPTRDHNVCTLSRDEDMHGVSFSASVRIRMGHVLCSFKVFKTKMASAEARCFRKHSQTAALSPRASSKSIASSGGAPVLVRKDTHAGPQRLPAAAVLFVPSQTDHGILGLKDFRVKRF